MNSESVSPGRQDGWISVKERMPDSSMGEVMVWVNSYYQHKGGHDIASRINGKWMSIAIKGWHIPDKEIDFWKELPVGPDRNL